MRHSSWTLHARHVIESEEEPVNDSGYRGLVDSLASGELHPHGFLAAVESRVDASLPPEHAASGDNVVHFSAWRSASRLARD